MIACRLYDDGPTFDIRNRPFIFLSHGVQSGRSYKCRRFSFLYREFCVQNSSSIFTTSFCLFVRPTKYLPLSLLPLFLLQRSIFFLYCEFFVQNSSSIFTTSFCLFVRPTKYFLLSFASLNNKVVYQNWKISGMHPPALQCFQNELFEEKNCADQNERQHSLA